MVDDAWNMAHDAVFFDGVAFVGSCNGPRQISFHEGFDDRKENPYTRSRLGFATWNLDMRVAQETEEFFP